MAFKDFVVIVGAKLAQDPERLVREELGLFDRVLVGTFSYDQLQREPDLVAVAEFADKTAIWWHDEAHRLVNGATTSLSTRLLAIQPPIDFAALYGWSTSNAYGFAIFEGGRCIRCRSGSLEGLHRDEGEPLPEEVAVFRASKEIGEHGLPLYFGDDETDEELYEHHQLGGSFVQGRLARRLIGGAPDELPLYDENVRWSAFGTEEQLESYRRRSRAEAIASRLRTFDLGWISTAYGLAEQELRDRFARALQSRIDGVLGGGLDLQTRELDGKIVIFAYFRVARWSWRGHERHEIGLKVARRLKPDILVGEQLGVRIAYDSSEEAQFGKTLRALGTTLPQGLAVLKERYVDMSLRGAARAALMDSLTALGVTELGDR